MGSRATILKIECKSDVLAVENAVANIQGWTGINNYAYIGSYLRVKGDLFDTGVSEKEHYYAYVIHDGNVFSRTLHISMTNEMFSFDEIDEKYLEDDDIAAKQKSHFVKSLVSEMNVHEILGELPESGGLGFDNVRLVKEGSIPRWRDYYLKSETSMELFKLVRNDARYPYVAHVTDDYEPTESMGAVDIDEMYETFEAGAYTLDHELSEYGVRLSQDTIDIANSESLRCLFSISNMKWEFYHKESGKTVEDEYIPEAEFPIFATLYVDGNVDDRIKALKGLDGVSDVLAQCRDILKKAKDARD